jgi:hypothetical protein
MSLVSDNFVKRNLKRKFNSNYKKNTKNKRAFLKRENDYELKAQENRANQDEQKTAKGLNSWGIDPLSISLRKISGLPTHNSKTDRNDNSKTNTVNDEKFVRGLTVSTERKAGCSKYKPEEVEKFRQCAPKCTGHQMPSRLYLVNKSGPNKVSESRIYFPLLN